MEGTSIALNLLSIIEQGEVLSEYKIRVALDPKQKLSTWNESSSLFTNWANAGGHYDCQVWSPKEDEVDFGSGFLQSRDCLQNQKRTETQREFDEFSDSFRNTGTKIHARTVTEGETQSATGSRRDWNAFSSTYTEWNDFGSEHSYSAWDPEASNQVSDFVQNRGYKHSQERFEQKREKDAVTSDIREIGLPIRHTQDDARSESRNINVSWTSWTNTPLIDTHSCTTWGPEPGMKGYNESYTQTRGCQEPQVRTRSYKSGSSLINAKTESRSAGNTESRGAIGTGSWSVTSSIYTSWVNSGGAYAYSSYSPSAGSQTSSFSQSRTYKQNQTRKRQERERDSISGAVRNVGSQVTESRVLNLSTSRSIIVSVGGWSNNGSAYNYTSWSPSPSSINYGTSFTQSRTYNQDRQRTWLYKSGSSTINSRNENTTITLTQNKNAVGTKNYSLGKSFGSWSSWSNSGGAYSCGSYSPSASTQTSSFSQSRTCKQNRVRSRTEYENYADGSRKVIGTVSETVAIDISQSRSVSVSVGNWVNSGSAYGHTSWSPDASTVNSGQSFTQSRTYSQGRKRTWSYVASSSLIGSRSETVTITPTETRSSTGTKVIYGTWQTVSNSAPLQMPCGFPSNQKSGSCTNIGETNVYVRIISNTGYLTCTAVEITQQCK